MTLDHLVRVCRDLESQIHASNPPTTYDELGRWARTVRLIRSELEQLERRASPPRTGSE